MLAHTMHSTNSIHSSTEGTSSTSSAAAEMQMLHQARNESAAAIAASAVASEVLNQTEDEPVEPVSVKQATPRKVQSLDLDSISMFPSLGSSSAAPARPAATWGAGPSARVKSAAGKLGAVGDQRRSPAAAAAAAANAASASVPKVSSSGNIQDRMQIPSVQISGFGKSSVGDIAKAVMTSSGARIESTTSMTSGTTTFLISGKPEAVAKARRDLRSSFAKKVINA